MTTATTFKRSGDKAALADPAPATALKTPGGTRVSSLLMQDTVSAAIVSIAPSLSAGTLAGRVALFANPYLDGQEEALVINVEGQLTYLRRAATETGWEQSPVTGGGASEIKAAEVVVVIHPTDLTVWAIYTSPLIHQEPQALQLVADAATGVTAWQPVPGAISGTPGLTLRMSRLYVYYDGRTPYISGIDPVEGGVVRIAGNRGSVARFYWQGYGKAAAFSTVDDFVAGRVSTFPRAAHPAAPIGYVRQGSRLVRFNLQTGESPQTIATDAARIIGIYPMADVSDLGCVYLDTAGNLVTWNTSAQFPSTGTAAKVKDLGFVAATSWIDVNLMVHVYGLDSAGTLKVLHQSRWDTISGHPVWSCAKAEESTETVPVCMGLVPKVAAFAVDPFPDHQPNELVKLEGAKSPDETFSFYAQDLASARWSRDKVRLPPKSPALHRVTNYVSTVTVLDQCGNPMPSLTVQVSAESLAEIQVDGASYLVGPGRSTQLPTNALGTVTIALPADGLAPATLHVDAVGLTKGAVIDPAAAVQDYLAGTGTLGSQQGLFDETALANAKVDGVPLVVGKDNRDAIPGTVTSIKNTFKIASGQPVTSMFYQGSGPAPQIHGFAFGSALNGRAEGPAVYHELPYPEDFEAHLAQIRKLPEYGGLWDDFTNWAGDVWQGIKDGVVKVGHVIFGPVIKVLILIGGKLVELAGFILDTAEAAVHVVEAVFSEIAVAAAKVVDWLKALFSFKDIWDTKTALESGMKQMLSYGVSTVEHFGDVAHGWFSAQSAKAHAQLGGLKTTYAQRAVGDAANQIPIVTDASGQAASPAGAARDPQSSWLLNQALGAPAAAAARAAAPPALAASPISGAFAAFLAKLESTGVDQDVERISGDPYTAAGTVTDPRDPDGAAKASAPALIDTLLRKPAGLGSADGSPQDLLDAILGATDEVAATLLELLKTVAGHFSDVMALPLSLGPVNTLYTWIQTQAEVEDPEELTLGGLVFLIGAFAFTTTYKLFNGVDSAPFPGGVFPVPPPPPWHPAYDAKQVAAPDPGDMRRLQIAAGAFGILGCLFDGMADMFPMVDWNVGPKDVNVLEPLIAAGGAVFTQGLFGMIGACPPVVGLEWTEAGGAWAGAFAVQSAVTLLSLGTIVWAFAVPGASKILRNVGEVVFGPLVLTGLGTGALIATAVGVARGKQEGTINDYAAAQAILFPLPAVLQFLRVGATWKVPDPEVLLFNYARCAVVAGIDVLATGCSASMLLAAAALSTPPVIPSQKLPDAVIGRPYRYTIQASGGDRVFNSPRKAWKLTGQRLSLPAGLTLDAEGGVISGTPQPHTDGIYPFSVTCTDSFGPPQPADPGQLVLHIKK